MFVQTLRESFRSDEWNPAPTRLIKPGKHFLKESRVLEGMDRLCERMMLVEGKDRGEIGDVKYALVIKVRSGRGSSGSAGDVLISAAASNSGAGDVKISAPSGSRRRRLAG